MSKRVKAAMFGAVATAAALVAATVSVPAGAEDAVQPRSANVLAFAPGGVLLIGDSIGGQVCAVETGDTSRAGAGAVNIEGLTAKIAATLSTTPDQVALQDIAVNPMSGAVFISVNKGTGDQRTPVILRADRTGALTVFDVAAHKSTHVAITDAPAAANQRAQTITDLGFVSGKVLVAGLSNEEFSSSLRAISYPLTNSAKAAGIEMYHGNHSRTETASPVRTFLTYDVDGKPNVLAAYTCTPLVKIPVDQIRDGARIKATTIAELGAGNQPLDMISYQKDGKPVFLMANSRRGVMKLDASNLERHAAITQPVPEGTAGVPYTTVAELTGVTQLDKVDNTSAVIVIAAAGNTTLKTIGLP